MLQVSVTADSVGSQIHPGKRTLIGRALAAEAVASLHQIKKQAQSTVSLMQLVQAPPPLSICHSKSKEHTLGSGMGQQVTEGSLKDERALPASLLSLPVYNVNMFILFRKINKTAL